MTSLHAPPADLVDTRLALHRLAAYVIAPARHRMTERFGLRAVDDGFGTPPFGGRQILVVGDQIVDRRDGEEDRTGTIGSLADAAAFLGEAIDEVTAAEHDTPAAGDQAGALAVGAEASRYLGAWFAMAFDALHELRNDAASVDASEPQLWPGHFDPAIEAGDDNHRASYGASPGDASSDVPYLYISVWWPDRLSLDRGDPFWNAEKFVGAKKLVSQFDPAADPVDEAIGFWRSARDHLAAMSPHPT